MTLGHWTKTCGAAHRQGGELVANPVVKQEGQAYPSAQQYPYLCNHLALRDATCMQTHGFNQTKEVPF
eukprot:1158020-Pelagomonas_calceolata.AAC.3